MNKWKNVSPEELEILNSKWKREREKRAAEDRLIETNKSVTFKDEINGGTKKITISLVADCPVDESLLTYIGEDDNNYYFRADDKSIKNPIVYSKKVDLYSLDETKILL